MAERIARTRIRDLRRQRAHHLAEQARHAHEAWPGLSHLRIEIGRSADLELHRVNAPARRAMPVEYIAAFASARSKLK